VLIEDWQRIHLAGRRHSYAHEAVRALHVAFADRLDDAAEDLDRTAVVRALDALTRRHKRENGTKHRGMAMTGRTAAYGRAAYAWAVKRGAVAVNPFAALPMGKSVTNRERVLSDQELAEIWRAASDVAAPYGSIVRLLILTGQRRGEVAGMSWNEIADDLTAWTMPGDRTKNGAVHVVPLSSTASKIIKATLPADAKGAKRTLAELRAAGALILPGEKGAYAGWSKAKRALDDATAKKSGAKPAAIEPWSIHDLRRTVATGLQRLGVRLEVTEAVLNHVSGSRGGIAGVYQRHDWAAEKRAALDAWAAHVAAIIEGHVGADNVVALRQQA
jgi:integrase